MSSANQNSDRLKDLLFRLRRTGWVLLGDQQIADQILLGVFANMEETSYSFHDSAEFELIAFKLAINAYEAVLAGRGRILLMKNGYKHFSSMFQHLQDLSLLQKISITLIAVENFTVKDAAYISSRPQTVLITELQSALTYLESKNIKLEGQDD